MKIPDSLSQDLPAIKALIEAGLDKLLEAAGSDEYTGGQPPEGITVEFALRLTSGRELRVKVAHPISGAKPGISETVSSGESLGIQVGRANQSN